MRITIAVGLVTLLAMNALNASRVALWDFTQASHGWTGNRMVTNPRTTKEGWVMDVHGPDPSLVGPAMDWPVGQFGMVSIRMRSTGDNLGQLFYGTEFSEAMSRTFAVRNDGQWHEYRMPLPPLPRGSRLRFDPSSAAGTIAVAWIHVESSPEKFTEEWATARELRGKKIIGGGQYTTTGGKEAITSRYLATHPNFFELYPFDGMVVPVVLDSDWAERLGLPRRDYFLHELLWNTVELPYEALGSAVADLNSVKWGAITDNFLNYTQIDGARGRFTPDLADDRDWAIVEHNAAMAARLCRDAKFQGFWLDTEQYGNYRWRSPSGVPEFDTNRPTSLKFPLGKDTPEVLRKRGAQWIKAVQAELPGVKIMITFAWSPDADGYGPLKGTTAFLNGVLDAIQPPAQLIHGYENTFYYGQGPGTRHTKDGFPGDRGRFEAARASIRSWRALSSNPAKYDRFVSIGMAAWIEDDPWNLWSGWPSGSKDSFWSNLPFALAYSDEYVWVWSEHTRYRQGLSDPLNPFLASLCNRTFNTGREGGVSVVEDFSTDPMSRGWHFDFDMLAIGRKTTPAHDVPLMNTDTVPYVWDRSAGGVRVRGEAPAGSFGQRRRYVLPIQPVNQNPGIGAELDFRVDAFGDGLDNPMVLGLFSSEQTIRGGSLTLQIAAPDRVNVVLAESREPVQFPLSVPGGIKTGQTYRFAIESMGTTGRLRASLTDLSTGVSRSAQLQTTTINSSKLDAWDELGIALWETVSLPRQSQNPYRYLLVKATCRPKL